jgi:hypothetical protein
MQFLLSLPKALLVFLALFISLMLIIIAQPFHTACQSQLEVIKANQTGFLFLDEKIKYRKTTGYEKAVEVCKYGNSSGGCLDFFNGMKRVYRDLEFVGGDCTSEILGESIINKTLWDSTELMVQLAWGSKPPASYLERQGWFDTFHLSTFCDLKRLLITHYGKDRWSSFIDGQLKGLPQAATLSRNEAWQRTVLSFPCESIN